MKRRPTLSLPRFVVLQDGKPHQDDDGEVVHFRKPAAQSFIADFGGEIIPAKEYNFAEG